MAAPTAYTEDTLRWYMLGVTGGIGTKLALATEDFAEAVNDVLIAYGVFAAAAATDIARLRALAKVEAWRTAKAKVAGSIDFSADGASFKRSDLIRQVQMNLETAEAEAMAAGVLAGYVVTTGTFSYPSDPYPLPTDDEDE